MPHEDNSITFLKTDMTGYKINSDMSIEPYSCLEEPDPLSWGEQGYAGEMAKPAWSADGSISIITSFEATGIRDWTDEVWRVE
jgi:hypothetical protein